MPACLEQQEELNIFCETGEGTEELLAHLEECEGCAEVVDVAFQECIAEMHRLGRNIEEEASKQRIRLHLGFIRYVISVLHAIGMTNCSDDEVRASCFPGVSNELAEQYSNACSRYGPDSPEAHAIRDARPGDTKFIEFADGFDRLKRRLGGSGIDYPPAS